MRIVAGEQRGRSLVAPKGQSTRPTADKTRQAIFNVLEHAPWGRRLGGARVVDLFAGSGALGLEALSRGAASCLFVDSNVEARTAIAANLDALGLTGRARIASLLAGEGSADLVFLDPPYGAALLEPALGRLVDGGWLAAGALVIAERGADEPAPAAAGYALLDERRWGAARVSFLTPL